MTPNSRRFSVGTSGNRTLNNSVSTNAAGATEYRHEVDGLRALEVLTVEAYHYDLSVPGATVLDIGAAMCSSDACLNRVDGHLIYLDPDPIRRDDLPLPTNAAMGLERVFAP